MNEVKNTISKLKESQSSSMLVRKLEKTQSEDKLAATLNNNPNNNNPNNTQQNLNMNQSMNNTYSTLRDPIETSFNRDRSNNVIT